MEDTNGQVRRRGPERRPTSTYIVSWDLPRLTAFSVEAVNYAGEGPRRRRAVSVARRLSSGAIPIPRRDKRGPMFRVPTVRVWRVSDGPIHGTSAHA